MSHMTASRGLCFVHTGQAIVSATTEDDNLPPKDAVGAVVGVGSLIPAPCPPRTGLGKAHTSHMLALVW